MSETKHYIGKLIPTGKTLKEFDPEAIDIYDHYERAVEIDGLVYIVRKKNVCYDDVFRSKVCEDGSIDFEVKYHNGVCCFYEAISNALENKGE